MTAVHHRPVMVITGAAGGIGTAVARAAAATHDLVLDHRGPAGAELQALVAELRDAGADAVPLRADVAEEDEVVALFRSVDERFGRIDALVNNAGVAGGYGSLSTVTATALAQLWAVNLTGAFLCAREAAARMSTATGGRGGAIINVSSRAAVLGGPGEWVHYAASKGALDTMTVGLAKELAAVGIRVNGVRPGLVDTAFHRHADAGRMARLEPTVPMQRAGTAAEVAAAVVWLASPAASYVTGALLDVAGGR